MLREKLGVLIEGGHLDVEGMADAVGAIMEEEASPAQIGAFLTALRLKGETEEEIAGAAMALRDRCVRLPGPTFEDAVDTCGTGGDGAGTVNVSTLSALVAAGAGAKVAKHGNRSVSSKCGSADLLTALGVKVDASPELSARCLAEAGFAFLFAPIYHPAMKAVAPVRQEMGIRTLFNLIGPLCNPAGVRRQVVGVYSMDLVPLVAGVLRRLGSVSAMVVSSEDGLDEISVCAPTRVAYLRGGEMEGTETLDPASLGFKTYDPEALQGGEPEENAEISLAVLKGAPGAVRDAVVLNAAAALHVAGRAGDLSLGVGMAAAAIDSGSALAVLEKVKSITGEQAGE
jgi:anthranilate phosphoribosyltransferase